MDDESVNHISSCHDQSVDRLKWHYIVYCDLHNHNDFHTWRGSAYSMASGNGLYGKEFNFNCLVIFEQLMKLNIGFRIRNIILKICCNFVKKKIYIEAQHVTMYIFRDIK